jgi:hypothetical protein
MRIVRKESGARLNDEQMVIDLVRLLGTRGRRANYQLIC